MENEKDKTAATNDNAQPKPTDDPQLAIETVVPEAHKTEVSGEKPDNEDTGKDNDQEEASSESLKTVEEHSPKDDDKDDQEHGIETVTPSA